MPNGEFNLVLNTVQNVEQAKLNLDRAFNERTIPNGEIFHVWLKEFESPKTHKQLAAIGVLCQQLSETVSHDYSGHSRQYWKNYYKLRAYIPLLKIQAHEKNDDHLVYLIDTASNLLRQQKSIELFKTDPNKLLDLHNEYLKALYETGMYTFDACLIEAKKQTLNNSTETKSDKQDYTVNDFIAENEAFSYSKASKVHLISVITYMLDDAKKNGIHLELKNKDALDKDDKN